LTYFKNEPGTKKLYAIALGLAAFTIVYNLAEGFFLLIFGEPTPLRCERTA
jgi:hypothetical protein